VSDLEVINLDIISGNTDVAGIWLPMDDFPLYAENQERGDYKVANTTVSNIQYSILFFNMAHQDEAYREVFQNLKFRQAMSHALDREQYVEAVFYGFGEPAQLAPYPGTPYYPEGGQESFAAYDPEKSESLLDEIGLVDTDDDGWREFPNGEDFVIQIDVAPIGPATVPSCELAKRYWEEVGVRVNMKEIESSLWWDLHEANEIMVSSWWAHGAKPSDVWHLGFRMNTPQWRAWFTTSGAEGVEPLPWAKEMLEAQRTFETAASREEAIEAGKRMWAIQRDYIPILGMVSGPRLPWIYTNDLGNLADDPLNLEYPAKTIMGAATQWYFTDPERR
jgi:peptide/nickel transport system substrate-binding protein